MTSPLFTSEQWQAIESLFESRLERPGSSSYFGRSITFADQALKSFERYFETLSPQLTGLDKEHLFTIKNDLTDIRHATYQAAGSMEIRYKKFRLQPAQVLIEHLHSRADEQMFKKLVEQLQLLQEKLTKFHSSYFWCEVRKWGMICVVIGGVIILFGKVLSMLTPQTVLSTMMYISGIALVLGGFTALGLIKYFEHRRDPTSTMRYLEELHKQIDKLRFQFDDLKSLIADDTPHEFMQQELNVVIESIKELKLLCFP